MGALGAWLLAQGRANGDAAPSQPLAPALEVVEVAAGSVQLVIRTHGSVAPEREIELVAEVAGRLRS